MQHWFQDGRTQTMPVMLLHGFPLDGRMWEGQAAALPLPTSAPTLYRLGESMTAWAGNLLKAAAGDPLVVVGCSVGGSCALEMAHQAGDCIAALVLVGAKAEHRPEPDLCDRYITMLREGGVRKLWSEMAGRFFGPAAELAAISAAEAIAMTQCTEDLIRAVQVFHSRPDAANVLAGWRKPVLVVGGDEDGFVSMRKLAAVAAAAPHGRLHVMRGCGHFANLERPAEFNAVLADFIRSALDVAA
jgi:pimeloyl-ACP methyl ester carboxylesterase